METKEEKFKKTFPELFEIIEPYNLYIAPGWEKILWNLCGLLSHYKEVKILQIKEKFGGLRFYTGVIQNKRISKKVQCLIENAERESYHTCEKCGNPGKQRTDGWIVVWCDACYNLWKKNRL